MQNNSGLEWPVNRIRSTFIEYFEKKQHTFWRSSKTVPHDDPTLLFTNSGMNQFKPIFLGTVDPKSELGKLRRAANSQKCIRAGGKHNDLDDVGKDTYHHTFFEMLGNWSFGDYFKVEAIDFSWDLLINVYHLDPARLYATYFAGNEAAGVPPDNEARQLWLKYLPADRVLPFVKENFWEMGETGPCGPCTEIHYDLLGGRFVPELVNRDDPSLIEIWNNVFMQFNREADGSLVTLPHKHVDTGMGLERLACVLQNKTSNYDTDVFESLFGVIQSVTNVAPYGGRVDLSSPEGRLDMAYRVLADHARCLSVALADGARPGPEGRDYVVRRILRRAIRYGSETMKAPPGFFVRLIDAVCESLGDAFPEVREHRAETVRVMQEEEESFGRTLVRGSQKLGQMIDRLPIGARMLTRDQVFQLYDTFGFPVDLTEIMASERGVPVDRAGFEEKMARRRAEDKLIGKSHIYGGEAGLLLKPEARDELVTARAVPATDDSHKYLGSAGAAESKPLRARVLALWSRAALVPSVRATGNAEDRFVVILDRTSFYAESGGQMGDMGTLRLAGGAHFEVEDCQRDGPFVLHIGYVKQQGSTVAVGDEVDVVVDADRRDGLMRNHTGTHMVNHALRDVLGDGVEQKGSLVASDRLRFDYNAKEALSDQQISRVRNLVTDMIRRELPVSAVEVELSRALEISGIRAMFGETYPNPVRVVSVGVSVEELAADPKNAKWRLLPVELCGGTHLLNTRDAKEFVVLRDDALARGVRRLLACTGAEAARAIEEGDRLDAEMQRVEKMPSGAERAEELKSLTRDLVASTVPAEVSSQLHARIKVLQTEGSKARLQDEKEARLRAGNAGKEAAQKAKEDGRAFSVVCEPWFPVSNPVLQEYLSAFVDAGLPALAIAADDKKVMIIAVSPADCAAKLNAVEWVKAAAVPVDGKGGGAKDGRLGQAAGKDPSKVTEAVAAAAAFASATLA
jgi:alanyl-tRNA synthetase